MSFTSSIDFASSKALIVSSTNSCALLVFTVTFKTISIESVIASSTISFNELPSVFPHTLHVFGSLYVASCHLCDVVLVSLHILHVVSQSLSYTCVHSVRPLIISLYFELNSVIKLFTSSTVFAFDTLIFVELIKDVISLFVLSSFVFK